MFKRAPKKIFHICLASALASHLLFGIDWIARCSQSLAEITGKPVITLVNYSKESESLNGKIASLLDTGPKRKDVDWTKTLQYTDDLCRHVVQNTIQHGSPELEHGDFENAKVPISYQVFRDQSDIWVVVTNPKTKPFPKSLQREFFPGDYVQIPSGEREGFTGNGIGHFAIFRDLEKLPSGSAIKWEADNETVTFRLKLHVQ